MSRESQSVSATLSKTTGSDDSICLINWISVRETIYPLPPGIVNMSQSITYYYCLAASLDLFILVILLTTHIYRIPEATPARSACQPRFGQFYRNPPPLMEQIFLPLCRRKPRKLHRQTDRHFNGRNFG